MSVEPSLPLSGPSADPSRRDFLFIATGAAATVGVAATLWPMIDQMNPDASTLAAAGPVDIDLAQLEPGQQIVVLWAARPVFVVNRPQAALDGLRDPKLLARLSDPDSSVMQQPAYADNWCRSIKPETAGARRHLYASGLHPKIFSEPQRQRSRALMARRILLPLPRLEIRSRRTRLLRRAGALQFTGPALSLRHRKDFARRRESAGRNFRFQFCRSSLSEALYARVRILGRTAQTAQQASGLSSSHRCWSSRQSVRRTFSSWETKSRTN